METGVSREGQERQDGLSKRIGSLFGCEDPDLRTYSPLALAFVGDGVYDLVIRTAVVSRANAGADRLHKAKSRVVKASAQAAQAAALLPDLTPEELAVYRRGRNAHSHSVAKNASVGDYRRATGLEALCGYLYLSGQEERLLDLIKTGLERTGEWI